MNAVKEGDPLSPREEQILGLIAQGLLNKEIAAYIGRGEATVKNFISQIFIKRGYYGRGNRIAMALEYLHEKEQNARETTVKPRRPGHFIIDARGLKPGGKLTITIKLPDHKTTAKGGRL
jgi:DNA-binding CsgD family transcriptional regulator